MSPRKKVVEKHISGFSRGDRPSVLSTVTDDVEYRIVTEGARARGKAEYEQYIGLPPEMELRVDITRMTEEGNVIVAEGIGHLSKKGGGSKTIEFCDIFEFEGEKVKRLTSFRGPGIEISK